MQSIYDQFPETFTAIEDYAPNTAAMARRFSHPEDMDDALGYSRGAVKHCARGDANVSRRTEKRATEWLAQADAPQLALAPIPQNAAPAPAEANSGPVMLLGAGTAASMHKATRVLELLGCEVTPI